MIVRREGEWRLRGVKNRSGRGTNLGGENGVRHLIGEDRVSIIPGREFDFHPPL